MKRLFFAQGLASGALLVACGAATSARAASISYAYDASVPLDDAVETTENETGVRISNITYRSGPTLVRAALVKPTHASGHMPAVLFAHWLGNPETSDRREFLEDAKWLARRGVVSLVPDQPWSKRDWFARIRRPETDDADAIGEVIELRRSIDLLARTPGVDLTRIAFVGHDLGATYGALLAGADTRLHAFVFMAPTVTLAERFLLDTARPPSDPRAYAAKMAAFDIPASLATIAMPTLVQIAQNDASVPRENTDAFVAALSPRIRDVRRYPTDHALAIDAATDDRREWLARTLDLS